MELITEYYSNINDAQKYICDRCGVAELRVDEYQNNRNERGVYCEECWNWIHLITWTDSKGYHTLRSERRNSSLK